MKRKYGVYGLGFGLLLASLVIIGMIMFLVGSLAEAYPLPPPGESPPESDTEWNTISMTGAVLSVLGLAHVVLLPISMHADTKFVRQTTGWRPLRILWVPLSVLPLLQIPITIVYLLRRTYLLTLRPRLTGRQPDANNEAVTVTDSQQSVANRTVSEQTERSPPSLSQRVVSSLRKVGKTVSYISLSYFLALGVTFGIGNLLGLEDTVKGLLLIVLWPGSYWVLR
jgi:hypothetical protein